MCDSVGRVLLQGGSLYTTWGLLLKTLWHILPKEQTFCKKSHCQIWHIPLRFSLCFMASPPMAHTTNPSAPNIPPKTFSKLAPATQPPILHFVCP